MGKKKNLKSVRISDEVLDYIINFEGDGFNQKFENLVLFCMKEAENKRFVIQHLEDEIQAAYNKLDFLGDTLAGLRRTSSLMKEVEAQLLRLSSVLDNLDRCG